MVADEDKIVCGLGNIFTIYKAYFLFMKILFVVAGVIFLNVAKLKKSKINISYNFFPN